ncbi:MAG: host attachment protein [Proteobacteria bacterium]|jgi:protein required for attachment to host cells|nr:host attachment protein [Pseudomonadota bacterium]
MKSTWILVADSSRARIFTTDTRSGPLQELETLAHPEGREHEQNMTSDLPGRDSSRMGGERHSFQDETDPKEYESNEFARHIAQHLDSARKAGDYDQLIIVAAPKFLGSLRSNLTEPSGRLIALEINKNLTQHDAADIRKHLPEYLPNI